MSQQPFFPPQYPQQPYAPQPQGYPQQPFQQAPPQQGFPQQGYAPQVPPTQPTVPLAQGSLSDFYNQPSVGGGPSIAWTDKNTQAPKPIGTTYVGMVARDVTSADVQQQTDFKTQQPLFYRDGRPKFAMKVPLKVQASQEFPEGEASWFVKGQAKDELQRAMSAAGVDGAPKEGAVIAITLVQRRPSGPGMNPANIVQVDYRPAGAQAGQAPAQATEAPSPVAVAQPVQQYAAQPVQQVQPQYAPQAPQPVAQQPVQQYAPQQVAQPVQQVAQAPAQAAPSGQGFAMPEGLSPEQQQLFAQLAGNQAQG